MTIKIFTSPFFLLEIEPWPKEDKGGAHNSILKIPNLRAKVLLLISLEKVTIEDNFMSFQTSFLKFSAIV